MDKAVIEALGLKMVEAVRDAVKRATDPLEAQIKGLQEREPEKGEKGDAGKDFDPAILGPHIAAIKSAATDAEASLKRELAEAIAAIPTPKDGKSVEPEQIAGMVAEEVSKAVAALPKPKDGIDADPEFIRAEVAKAVAAIPLPKPGEPGKDAEPIHPDTLARMVADEVEKAVAKIHIPKDGDPGKDGKDALQIEPLPSIDEAKSYPAGTYATHMGGTIKAVRKTDPIGAAGLLAAGWQVITEGVAGLVVTQGEDPREIHVTSLLTGGLKATASFRVPMVIDRGVWKPGTYNKGDGATLDGSFWISQKDDNTDRPGTSDAYRLAVKRGRDGKDAGDGKSAPHKPVTLK